MDTTPIVRSALVLILLSACAPSESSEWLSKSPSSPSAIAVASAIADTARAVSAIDDAKDSMQKVERAIVGESTEGTRAVGYIDGSMVRAVEASVAGETFRATSDIYFDERGDVIFIREVEERYDKPMYEPGFVVVSTMARLYHFADGKALLVEENGSTVEGERSQRMADAALAFASRVAAAIRQPESSAPRVSEVPS